MSGASLQLRRELLEHMPKVAVNPAIPLAHYFEYSRALMLDANRSIQFEHLWKDSFIKLMQFSDLVLDGIPHHPSYRTPIYSTDVKKSKVLLERAVTLLELLVAKMDRDEEARLSDLLFREFDMDATDDDATEQSYGASVYSRADAHVDEQYVTASSVGAEPTNVEGSGIMENYVASAPTPVFYPPFPSPSSSGSSAYPSLAPMEIASAPPSVLSCPADDVYETFNNDRDIIHSIPALKSFPVPYPAFLSLQISIASSAHRLQRHDFSLSFTPFLAHLSGSLLLSKSAAETNRCFFLHLGVAVNVHPFFLQAAFRYQAFQLCKALEKDSVDAMIMQSVLEYAGLVDANTLCYLWPKEFNRFAICIISGSKTAPLLSVFKPKFPSSEELTEIVLHCEHDHFTLLKPAESRDASFKIVEMFVSQAKAARLAVQEYWIDSGDFSLESCCSKNFSRQWRSQ